ncbi:MAG: CIA30 family protein [Woeseiaceae bacterium]|nr:CIA30 family protein [Woeseiaceae bacterium]
MLKCTSENPIRIALSVLALLTMVTLMSEANADEPRMLFEFEGADPGRWAAVHDTVMGGRSEGGAELRDGVLRFSGNLSLANNGGFASMRNAVAVDLSGRSGIRLRVRGDGRSYGLRLQTEVRYFGRAVSWSGSFATEADEWVEVDVPFESLAAGFRGRSLDGYEFDPARIELIGVLLGDKNEGPFQIEIDWIAAY